MGTVHPPSLEPPPETPSRAAGFPVVGIGLSEGGLEALFELVGALPRRPGMAFIVVQHAWPGSRSRLGELLQRRSPLPVVEASDVQRLEPDRIYVVPARSNATLEGATLRLSPKPEHPYIAHSVDFLFRSMANQLESRAVGIVLSGNGSDGAFGAKMINHRLGMVMVQAPESAERPSMPDAVIRHGVADYVLRPAEMPGRLLAYVRRYYGEAARRREQAAARRHPVLRRLFDLVKHRTDTDITIFKPSTVLRRIDRRMSVTHVDSLEDYLALLDRDPEEAQALVREFVIQVTGFFQDPPAFDALKRLLKDALASRRAGSTVNAWTLGCATGEDTYSVAILLRECLEELGKDLRVRLFATDVDPAGLALAHNGVYPASILDQDVSPDRLKRYFLRQDSVYRVRPEVRRDIVFTLRDFGSDPGFSGLDLISSRSLLVHLSVATQRRLVSIFHGALNPRGLVFPGTQDLFDDFPELFATLDPRWKIYRRR